MKKIIVAKNLEHLKTLINQEIKEHGNTCNLNHIDISNLDNLSGLFYYLNFSGDISKWNTSNITNMSNMFKQSKFNGDISGWDVSKVIDMSLMFFQADFNGDISNWNTLQVKSMSEMFSCSKFNGDINKWNVSKVEDMSYMFYLTPFTHDLSEWTPYSLKNPQKDNIFSSCPAPIPYWEKCINNEEIVKAINAYILNNELQQVLPYTGVEKRKVKI